MRRKDAVSEMSHLQYHERKCAVPGVWHLQYEEKVVLCEDKVVQCEKRGNSTGRLDSQQEDRVLEFYMDWFLSLMYKNYIFKHFVKTVEPTSLKFCTIIELITLHLEYTIAQVKYANFSYVHVQTFIFLNGEMATVSTGFRKLKFWLWLLNSDCFLPEPNQLLKDLLD